MRRRISAVQLLLAAALALMACSDSGSISLAETGAPVTGNNENYAYSEGSVPQSRWPNPCSLLSRNSAATALGTTVHVKRFHNRCFYSPYSATFPTLNLAIMGLGNAQSDTYDASVSRNSRFGPRQVRNLGRAAVHYQSNRGAVLHLDLLTEQGTFELTLTSPPAIPIGRTHGWTILNAVGRVLDKEFSG